MGLPASLLRLNRRGWSKLTKPSHYIECIVHARLPGSVGVQINGIVSMPFGRKIWVTRETFDSLVDRFAFRITTLREADEMGTP